MSSRFSRERREELVRHLAETRVGWENFPYDYNAFVAERASKLSQLDSFVLQECHGDVLDLGCATGRLSGPIREKSCPYVGLDIALRFLRCVPKQLTSRVVCAAAEELPFEDNSFDTVIGAYHAMRTVLPAYGYPEVFRVLRPGGVFVFTKWTRFLHTYQAISDLIRRREISLFNHYQAWVGERPLREERAMLQAGGFSRIEVRAIPLLPVVHRIYRPTLVYRHWWLAGLGSEVVITARKNRNKHSSRGKR